MAGMLADSFGSANLQLSMDLARFLCTFGIVLLAVCPACVETGGFPPAAQDIRINPQ